MRFLQVTERDGAYGAVVAEMPDVAPGPGEVLIRVTASGVNRADLSQIAGRYPPPPGEPTVLGLEVSGVVEGTGARVCALLAGGGHGTLVGAPAGQIFPCPPSLDAVQAAALPEAYLTAFVNLVVEAGLEAGQTVLVHAGASGVGLAAIQMAKYLGARVAATTRTREKLRAIEQAGADLALLVPSGDFAAPIEASFGPGAVDVVLDPIGGASLAGDLAVLALRGRIIALASMSGAKAELDLALLMKKRARIVGSTLRARTRDEKAILVRRFAQDILPGFAAGKLGPVVDSVFPPERAAEAFQRMRENKNVGKIVINWS